MYDLPRWKKPPVTNALYYYTIVIFTAINVLQYSPLLLRPVLSDIFTVKINKLEFLPLIFTSKAVAYLTRHHPKGRLLTMSANIRLGWK
jgi:hypothetical protein